MVQKLRKGKLGTNFAATILWIATAALGCAQLIPAPADMAAKVVELTGQVSVLHDSQPWALNVGDAIQVKQVIITGPDGFARFEVSDGSTFEVYPDSTVIFRNNAPNWRDLLDVFVGRVKIHIQKWGGQPNPNRIHTPTAVISVRGTIFAVSVDPDSENTVVSVEEGQVDVRHAIKGGETKILNAGESLEVYKSQPLASRQIDKSMVAQRVMRALSDAFYTMATNGSHLPTKIPGIGGGGLGGSGQTHPLPTPPQPTNPVPPPVAPPPPH